MASGIGHWPWDAGEEEEKNGEEEEVSGGFNEFRFGRVGF